MWMKPKQWKISRGMEWWRKVVFPVRRVWTGVASRLGIRKTGILKLQHDVRACQYEDVHVMWEMLQRNEMDQSPVKRKRDPSGVSLDGLGLLHLFPAVFSYVTCGACLLTNP